MTKAYRASPAIVRVRLYCCSIFSQKTDAEHWLLFKIHVEKYRDTMTFKCTKKPLEVTESGSLPFGSLDTVFYCAVVTPTIRLQFDFDSSSI